MQRVQQSGTDIRIIFMIFSLALVVAMASTSTVSFLAEHRGSNLSPRGGAEEVVDILQGGETILWSSLAGSVSSYSVTGWPSGAAASELGGALVIERPEDGLAGVIDFGEKPMALTFELDG